MVKLGLFIEPLIHRPRLPTRAAGSGMNQDSDVHRSGRLESKCLGMGMSSPRSTSVAQVGMLTPFLSSEVDARWSISLFEISARIGNAF